MTYQVLLDWELDPGSKILRSLAKRSTNWATPPLHPKFG